MKSLYFLVFLLISLPLAAQDFAAYNQLSMSAPNDYKVLETKVLEAANYLFSHPANENESNRLRALSFIIKWMEGTPDYTFSIGQEANELTKGNSNLFGLYLAAMSKTVLDNLDQPLNDADIHERSAQLLVDYVGNEQNGIKPNKAIKKLLKEKT